LPNLRFSTIGLDRYNYLIEMGKSLPVIDPKNKVDNNLIQGCQSRVWLHAEFHDGKIHFTADSDAVITRGIISLLIRALSDRTPMKSSMPDLNLLMPSGLHNTCRLRAQTDWHP
jgi:cysteine desulfuration protein SufE